MATRGAHWVSNEPDIHSEWPAPPECSHAVACTWTHRVGSSDRIHRVLPDGHADLIFFDSGEVKVAGMHDRVDVAILPAGAVARGMRV